MAVSGLTPKSASKPTESDSKPPESASRIERKRARNRDALLAAARKLFIRDGFERTTIAGIAEEADLGFGTFYRYFPDKESALREVLAEAGREVDAVLLAEDDASVSAPEALTRLTRAFALAATRNRAVFALWWQLTLTDGARARAARADTDAPLPVKLHAALAGIIERGVASGEFAAGDAALQAGIIASAHMFLLGARANDDGQAVETLCNFELRALGAASESVNGTRRRGQ
jgi:AcrR family transcriptional regulator